MFQEGPFLCKYMIPKNAEEASETQIIFVGKNDMDCLAIIAKDA